MDFSEQVCPVCGKKFNEDDDIAVCPECGTPHHRECYLKNGRCANESLHSTGFSFIPSGENKDTAEKSDSADKKNNQNMPPVIPTIRPMGFGGSDNENGNGNGENNGNPDQNIFREVFEDIENKSPEQILIDGKPSSYYEAAVGKNQNYYIPRFLLMDRSGKSFSWNIGAFFFPLAWAFYRKLYKLALVIMALNLIIIIGSSAPYFANSEYIAASKVCAEEDPAYQYNILMYQNGMSTTITPAQSKLIEVQQKIANEYPAALDYAFWALSVGICVAMGLFANKIYKDKLTKNIDRAIDMHFPEQQLKSFLYKKYGVLPFVVAVIIALAEWAFQVY